MQRIRAVFLDFYNTVARFDPPREQAQAQAAGSFGVRIDPEAVRKSYGAADEFLSRENGERALAVRSPDEVQEFWSQYEQLLLLGAGADVDLDRAGAIFTAVRRYGEAFALFDDAKPMLDSVGTQGYEVGLISNMSNDLWRIAEELGIKDRLGFVVTSGEVGASKPNPPIFLEALRRAGVEPSEAVHIGDQYLGDVTGARGAGIQPILIDRDGSDARDHDCPVIRTLGEVPNLLKTLEAARNTG